MPNQVNDKVLEAIRRESAYESSTARGGRRVKLEKGQSWIIRFLPAKMGPDGLWFARIAQHWHNRKPILCIKHTSPDYHGDSEYDCPVCQMAESLNDDSSKEISQVGFRAMANPNWFVWCLVLEKNQEPVSPAEMLLPYEFNMGRSVWDQLKGFYQNGLRRGPDSVLDYEKGNDFALMRNNNGQVLDKLDAAPIFDLNDKNFDAYIAKIEAQLKSPKVTVPNEKDLRIYAQKLEEDALDAAGSSSVPKRGRRGDDDDYDAAPRRGRGRSDDDAPPEDPAPRSRRSTAPAPQEEAAPRRSRSPEPDPEPRRRTTAPVDEPAPRRSRAVEDPAPRSRRDVDPNDDVPYGTSDPEGEPESGDEPPAPQETPRRSVSQADLQGLPDAKAPRRHADVDATNVDPGADDEQVPEERHDPAPAASTVLPADDDPSSGVPGEPPPVRRRLGTALKSRIEARG